MLKRLMLLCMTAAMLTGCASSGLVHDKDYLRAVYVSGNGMKNMTFSFFSDEGKTVSASGEDMGKALENAELKTGKPLFTGYTELVILGDCEYREVLEELLNDWKVSPSCTVVCCDNGAELLRRRDAELLSGQIRQAVKQGDVPESDIITVIGELLGRDQCADVPETSLSGVCGVRRIGEYS